MPASRFLKYTGRNWPNPVCSFYLPVSTSQDTTVDEVFLERYKNSVRDQESANEQESEREEKSPLVSAFYRMTNWFHAHMCIIYI